MATERPTGSIQTVVGDQAYVHSLHNVGYAEQVVFEAPVSAAVPRQLPAPTAHFVGRQAELRRLREMLTSGCPLAAVHGMPGVGKSALALRVAADNAERFPDAQLYVDLRGASGQSLDPGDVLAELAIALGADRRLMPSDPRGRAALFRSILYQRRALIVLDNAADAGQISPFLPGSDGCALLVTARRRLDEIDAIPATHFLELHPLPPEEGWRLLEAVAGSERIASDPQAARLIVQATAGLPLALRITAARLRAAPHRPLAASAARITRPGRALTELENQGGGVRAAIDESFSGLDPAHQRRLMLLGLLPDTNFELAAAAALLAEPEDVVEDALERLVENQLLYGGGSARYNLHQLVHAFAEERASTDIGSPDRHSASNRMIRWYLDTLTHHAALLDDNALTWCGREEPALLTLIDQTAAGGQLDVAEHLADRLGQYLLRVGHFGAARTAHTLILDAAVRNGVKLTQIQALNELGNIAWTAGRWTDAVEQWSLMLNAAHEHNHTNAVLAAAGNLANCFVKLNKFDDALRYHSLVLNRTKDPAMGLAALSGIASTYILTERYPESIRAAERAIAIARELGDSHSEMKLLNNLAKAHQESGNAPEAIRIFQDVVDHRQRIRDRPGLGFTLSNLAVAHLAAGDLRRAREAAGRALPIARETGIRIAEATALTTLAEVSDKEGDLPGTERFLSAALDVYRELADANGVARAARSLMQLRNLTRDLDGYVLAAGDLAAALLLLDDVDGAARVMDALNEAARHLSPGSSTPEQARAIIEHARRLTGN